MRAVAFYTYNDNYILSNSPTKDFQGKNCKSRFPVKSNRKFHTYIKRRKTLDERKNSEKLKFKNHELFKVSQGFEQIEECVFYSLNGIIHMATLPKSDN
ncbi:MAG: hypothetical protein IPI60_01845 [Saprospiraceae bacterium]|nr:hypothetical protein [Saprospiraceae bacterium]